MMVLRVLTSMPCSKEAVAKVCRRSWNRQALALRPFQHRLEPFPDGGRIHGGILLDREGNIHREQMPFL